MKTKLYSMAVIAMMICAGLSSCSKDDSSDEGGSGSTSGKEKGHEYVDLGLPSGTKWATCNIGASTPEGFGLYFAWGETKGYEGTTSHSFELDTYKYYNSDSEIYTKYCSNNSNGPVDDKMTLDKSDDAASANWGGKWRMPTLEEAEELCNKCHWLRTTKNGVKGCLVTGPSGNSIFLPEAGRRRSGDSFWEDVCRYWTSTRVNDKDAASFDVGHEQDYVRDGGLPVRAVMKK